MSIRVPEDESHTAENTTVQAVQEQQIITPVSSIINRLTGAGNPEVETSSPPKPKTKSLQKQLEFYWEKKPSKTDIAKMIVRDLKLIAINEDAAKDLRDHNKALKTNLKKSGMSSKTVTTLVNLLKKDPEVCLAEYEDLADWAGQLGVLELHIGSPALGISARRPEPEELIATVYDGDPASVNKVVGVDEIGQPVYEPTPEDKKRWDQKLADSLGDISSTEAKKTRAANAVKKHA